MKTLEVKVDHENNAEAFWEGFRESVKSIKDPALLAAFQAVEKTGFAEMSGPACVRFEEWVESIQGYDAGPHHAPTALICTRWDRDDGYSPAGLIRS